jgi:hypothetical protein
MTISKSSKKRLPATGTTTVFKSPTLSTLLKDLPPLNPEEAATWDAAMNQTKANRQHLEEREVDKRVIERPRPLRSRFGSK